ncbi:MAG: FtsX-like permease family protein [Alkalispirochaeta sp.]
MNPVIARIAYRNLRQHTSKTLIIGVMIALGIMVLVLGNGVMDTISAGIEESYVNNYTGHLFIAPAEIEEPSLTLSPELMRDPGTLIADYPRVREIVRGNLGVTTTTGQINGVAAISWGELGEGMSMFLGVDPESYQEMFPEGINLLAGSFLEPGEEGVVLSATVAEMVSAGAREEITPGDTVLLTAMNNTSGVKIRELTVRGIHDYGDASFDLSLVSFIDAENLRIMNGMTVGNVAVGDATTTGVTIQTETDDTMFAEDALFSEPTIVEAGITSAVNGSATDTDRWLGILGDLSQRNQLRETNPDAWSYLLVKLEDGVSINRTVREMNDVFAEAEIEVRAWAWTDGAGMSATLARTLQLAFNIILAIVAVVAVIIIMNTLVISVTERFGEIGTMRAIGARKGFVRSMIVQETLMITGVFGLIGIAAGWAVLAILGAIGIEPSNQFVQILLGTGVFRPALTLSSVVSALSVTALVGVVAALYPTAVALRISPLAAMNRP